MSLSYGDCSRQEIFYEDYFEEITAAHSNFSLHLALSSPVLEDRWTGHEGFIHEVLLEKDLRERSNAKAAEYYLCGPPMMIKACNKMLYDLVVPANHITYDEF